VKPEFSGSARRPLLGGNLVRLTAFSPICGYCRRLAMGKGLLLWMIGIPLPIILVIWLFGGLH
jgi:hypothetical protein